MKSFETRVLNTVRYQIDTFEKELLLFLHHRFMSLSLFRIEHVSWSHLPTSTSFHLKALNLIMATRSLSQVRTYSQFWILCVCVGGGIIQPIMPLMPSGFGHPHPCALGHVASLQEGK